MTDKEALMELLRGAVFGAIIVGGTALFAFGVNVTNSESKPEDRFKVVDTYSNCAIVRYRPENKAQDVFFLDCGNAHLSERE